MPRNNYRQIRATLTEESGGRFTLRVLAKPVYQPWHMRHVCHHVHWRMSDPPASLDQVLILLAREIAALVQPQVPLVK